MPGQIHAWVLIVAWLPVSRKVDMYPIEPNTPPPIQLKTVRNDRDWYYEVIYFKESRLGARQKPPYNLDLPYSHSVGLSKEGINHVGGGPYMSAYELDLESAATNQCRSKFMSMASDPSQYGSSLTTELGQTRRTIVGGISTALLAAKAVAKGDLLEAGRLLKFNPPVQTQRIRSNSRPRRKPLTLRHEASRRLASAKRPRSSKAGKPKKRAEYVYRQVWVMPDRRRVAAGLGNRWLWYSYGVSPLISDLYAASRTLTREFGTVRVEAGSSRKGSRTTPSGAVRWDTKVSKRLRADVRINNPNLFLASQLGLINPAQWINEGVRFSFVVDWFSNWSDWLGQLTDRAGLEMTNILLTTKVRQHYLAINTGPSVMVNDDWDLFSFKREVGVFPPVTLRFEYETPNWRRGLNAISLLLIQLRKPKSR